MFYLTEFHDNRVNTFGFMEGSFWSPPPPPQAQELQKKPRRNRVKFLALYHTVIDNNNDGLLLFLYVYLWQVMYCLKLIEFVQLGKSVD